MTSRDIKSAITKTLLYIKSNQNSDGSFDSLTYKGGISNKHKNYTTTFYTSLILYSLSSCNDKTSEIIKSKAVKFLLSQKSNQFTYSYWSKNTDRFKKYPLPDDMDDTACAIAAITSYDKNLLTEKDLAIFTKVLINQEVKIGGPYKTWILPKNSNKKWLEIDPVVNANIATALAQFGIKLPNINTLIEDSISKNNFTSPYYPKLSALYLYSRSYDGKLKNKIISILEEENSHFKNPLQVLLIGNSLINLGYSKTKLQKNLDYVYKNQKANGSFKKDFFIIESIEKGIKNLSCCPAFTSALAIEFLSKMQDDINIKSPVKEDHLLKIKKISIKHSQNILSPVLSEKMFQEFNIILNKLDLTDDGQITIHPFLFTQSLKLKTKIKTDFLLDLSAANIFGWVSYKIFDNVFDEKKDLNKIPLALILNRQLEKLFCENNPNFTPIFHKFINQVDNANYFEINNAKIKNLDKKIFPDVSFITDKSIAHALAPLSIIYKLGYHEKTQEFKKIYSFYKNYLVARQLNDDAHDWEEDLNRGQINFASEQLLLDFKKQFKTNIDFTKDKTLLRKIFWQKTILKICKIINTRISNARKDLKSISYFIDENYLSEKLEQLSSASQKALSERKKTLNYIKTLFK